MTEAVLEEPDFLKELHRIREKFSTEAKEQTFEEIRSIREKYRKKLGYLYIQKKK